jgi:hypothetical protein
LTPVDFYSLLVLQQSLCWPVKNIGPPLLNKFF